MTRKKMKQGVSHVDNREARHARSILYSQRCTYSLFHSIWAKRRTAPHITLPINHSRLYMYQSHRLANSHHSWRQRVCSRRFLLDHSALDDGMASASASWHPDPWLLWLLDFHDRVWLLFSFCPFLCPLLRVLHRALSYPHSLRACSCPHCTLSCPHCALSCPQYAFLRVLVAWVFSQVINCLIGYKIIKYTRNPSWNTSRQKSLEFESLLESLALEISVAFKFPSNPNRCRNPCPPFEISVAVEILGPPKPLPKSLAFKIPAKATL